VAAIAVINKVESSLKLGFALSFAMPDYYSVLVRRMIDPDFVLEFKFLDEKVPVLLCVYNVWVFYIELELDL